MEIGHVFFGALWQQLKTIAAPFFLTFDTITKEKGKSKKSARACACLASTSTGLNFIIRHYLPLPVYHAFCSVWSLGLLTVWSSQKAKFLSQLTRLFSCTCDHDSPSIWSPIVVPKQPRPVKLLPTQQDRAHWNLFFFTPHFNSRPASFRRVKILPPLNL